jgi:hypothetical protein
VKLHDLVFLTLAIPACAHTSVTRAPAHLDPAIDLRGLCDHPATSSFCAPVAPELPLVDTNLASPPIAPSPFIG